MEYNATKEIGYYRVIEPDFGGYEPDTVWGEYETLKEARQCVKKRIARDPYAYCEIVRVLSISKGSKCRH